MTFNLHPWLQGFIAPSRNKSADPGTPNPGVRIVNGKIIPQHSCQVEVASHCNLSCQDCNHLSPIAAKRYVDPGRLHQDLTRLARVYRPALIYLTGGEPLLHPEIVAVIDAIRASGISDRVKVLTNGLLLPRMQEAFWSGIDELEISVYPDSKITAAMLQRHSAQAKAFNVKLELYKFDQFRQSFTLETATDEALVRRIYGACKSVHVWGCHYVHDGYFYKCPQSAFLPRMLPLPDAEQSRDGIPIRDHPGFLQELHGYLTCNTPLQGCRNCLANAGIQRPHRQVRAEEWASLQTGRYEALVDYEELARIEAELHIQKADHIKSFIPIPPPETP